MNQAYWSGKYYPGYAWIIVDNFARWDWWNIDNNSGHALTNCTQTQFETVLNYSIIVTPMPADYNRENSAYAKVVCSVCLSKRQQMPCSVYMQCFVMVTVLYVCLRCRRKPGSGAEPDCLPDDSPWPQQLQPNNINQQNQRHQFSRDICTSLYFSSPHPIIHVIQIIQLSDWFCLFVCRVWWRSRCTVTVRTLTSSFYNTAEPKVSYI